MNPLSGVLGEAWQMYKAHASHLLPIAFVIYLGAAVAAALFGLLPGALGDLLVVVVSVFAGFVLQATLVKAVQDEREGRGEMSIGDTVRAAMPYLGNVAAASVLAGVAIAIGLALCIIPGLFLITIWAVIIPVIVIERAGAFNAFSRSQQLVKGRGWNVFGTLVLVYIVQLVAGFVLGLIFVWLPGSVRDGLSTVIAGTIIAPFLAVVVTLIYYRLVSSDPAGPAGETSVPGGDTTGRYE